MKKITLSLLTALGLSTSGFGQAISAIQAPPYDGSSTGLSLANGMANVVYHRSCYLILQSELTGLALTNSVITQVGIDLTQGCNVATTGQYTIYLQNTSDVAYNKGQTWSTILTGMTSNYTGNLTLPVNSGTATIPLTLGSSFTYTGGGIYIACDWYSAAPTATLPARTMANSTGLTLPATTGGGCYNSSSVTAAPATLTNTTNFRPAFRFFASNTATNEISVVGMVALGKVSKLFTAGHTITATIRNNGNATKTNVPVTLNVSGANTFNNTQTVGTIAAGGTANVSFSPFLPTTNGLNNMTVTVPADQVNTNNSWSWSQTVTCNDWAPIPPLSAGTFTDEQRGLNSACYVWKMTPPSNASLTAVNMAVSTETGSVGKTLYGIVFDASGNVLATSQTLAITTAMQAGVWTNFNFNPPFALTGNTPYYIGMAQSVSGFYPFGNFYPGYPVGDFYITALTGGAFTAVDRGYMGIGAIVSFSNTLLTAQASKTVVCKKDGPNTVTLTANGMSTYTWTPGGTGSMVVVSPTVSGASGAVNYTVNGTDGSTGCKNSAPVIITISVSACTALADNNSNGYNISLYPNPAIGGITNITGLTGTNQVTVLNTLGQVVIKQTVGVETVTIDLSNQPLGTYFVRITDNDNQTRMVKLINQK